MGFIHTVNPDTWKNDLMQIVLNFCKTMYGEPCDLLNKYWLSRELIPVVQAQLDAAYQTGYQTGYSEGQGIPGPAPG